MNSGSKKICGLCGKFTKVINSHILPEGFYRSIYDEERALFYSEQRSKAHKIQQGFKEYLLCGTCDNEIIGSYDKYAIEVIRDKKGIEFIEEKGIHVWKRLDSRKFKLFFLSLLWRAHISKRVPYESVQLDQDYIELIKSYILGSAILPDDFFPVFSTALINPEDGDICSGVITPIHTHYLWENKERKMYTIIFSGFCWNILAVDSIERHPQQGFFLSPDGEMISPRLNMYENKPFMSGFNSMINMIEKRANKAIKSDT